MPVDDQTADAGGRALGFPKYIADKIDLAETDGGWAGDVAFQGQSVMHVTFTPGEHAADGREQQRTRVCLSFFSCRRLKARRSTKWTRTWRESAKR